MQFLRRLFPVSQDWSRMLITCSSLIWLFFFLVFRNDYVLGLLDLHLPLTARQIEKLVFLSISLPVATLMLLSLWCVRNKLFNDSVAKIATIGLVACYISTAVGSNTYYMAYITPPLFWIFVVWGARNTLNSKALSIFTALIALTSGFLLVTFFVLLQDPNADFDLVKREDTLIIKMLPPFPLYFERQQIMALLATALTTCLFSRGSLRIASGGLVLVAFLMCDVRSAILALSVASIPAIFTLCYKNPVKLVLAFVVAIGFFGSYKLVVNELLDYPVGQSQAYKMDGAIALRRTLIEEGAWRGEEHFSNILKRLHEQPSQGTQIPTTNETTEPKSEIAGRYYESFFEDTGGRTQIWLAGLNRFAEKPLWGTGQQGTFIEEEISGKRKHTLISSLYHNSFLQTGIDYGVIVLICWLSILGALFLRASDAGKTLLIFVGIYYNFQNEFSAFHFSFPLALFFTVLPVLNSLKHENEGQLWARIFGMLRSRAPTKEHT